MTPDLSIRANGDFGVLDGPVFPFNGEPFYVFVDIGNAKAGIDADFAFAEMGREFVQESAQVAQCHSPESIA